MKPGHEDRCRAVARQLQQQRPGWLVLWGCYSQRFVAFPLFRIQRRVIVTATYPDALLKRMDETERALRLPFPEEELTAVETRSLTRQRQPAGTAGRDTRLP